MSQPPFPDDPQSWALFLDFDGTLTELVDTPEQVEVDTQLTASLTGCERLLGGALAIISGRPIVELDSFLRPARLTSAGLHGIERRLPDGSIRNNAAADPADLDRIREHLTTLVAADRRLLLEDKGATVALHYRLAPERMSDCLAAMREAVGARPNLEVLEGKMVVEVKTAGVDKGTTIKDFLSLEPFRGRRPVFAGDDVTDELGFAAINELGGISIKVGPGPTRASHRCADVGAFLKWLYAVAPPDAVQT